MRVCLIYISGTPPNRIRVEKDELSKTFSFGCTLAHLMHLPHVCTVYGAVTVTICRLKNKWELFLYAVVFIPYILFILLLKYLV